MPQLHPVRRGPPGSFSHRPLNGASRCHNCTSGICRLAQSNTDVLLGQLSPYDHCCTSHPPTGTARPAAGADRDPLGLRGLPTVLTTNCRSVNSQAGRVLAPHEDRRPLPAGPQYLQAGTAMDVHIGGGICPERYSVPAVRPPQLSHRRARRETSARDSRSSSRAFRALQPRVIRRLTGSGTPPSKRRPHVHFLDDSLFPENQEKVVITAAPYGPEWEPADFPEDIPLTMDQHVQQAVDCWEAGATVLHIHVRELDGKGSKRMSQFNELLRRLQEAVPEMILQVGGSISFAPEGDGEAKWLSDDTRHMLAELDPKPDQVTIAINTSQMNIVELMTDSDIAGTSFQ